MNTKVILSGHILEESPQLSLAELCIHCHIHAESMLKLVDQGIISPSTGHSASQWLFKSSSLARANKALRLQQDLNINLAGVALVLELLDEVTELRTKLERINISEA